MIINLHGFNSAGNNNTRDQLRHHFSGLSKVVSPTYSVHNFSQGMAELVSVVEQELPLATGEVLMFIGSSTGAVFAETLAKRYSARVAVINPVTDPGILRGALGENRNYRTDEVYEFTEQHLASFEGADIDWQAPRLVLVEKDDPVIDHDMTRRYYLGHGKYVEYPGDSHRFTFWKPGLVEIRLLFEQER